MDCDEWASSLVPLSPDEIGLRRNEFPREIQNMSGECERELTVYPLVPLPVLVCRFVETTRISPCRVFGSIVPSIA